MQRWYLAAVLLALAACTSGDGAKPAGSERERDSVLGGSKLPGAAGVRGALGASDSAAARRLREDSAGMDQP